MLCLFINDVQVFFFFPVFLQLVSRSNASKILNVRFQGEVCRRTGCVHASRCVGMRACRIWRIHNEPKTIDRMLSTSNCVFSILPTDYVYFNI